jgi:hypothetical protein
MLNRLERRFGRYAVPHLTIALIAVQTIVYVLSFTNRAILDLLVLVPRAVMQGEWWRVLTFLAIPPVTNPIFAFFVWYLFYLMGEALENHWGAFHYNVYLLIGYLATIGVSFLVPDAASSNAFLQASVFLAFAFLFPDFQIYLFFILPVKIKWLALLTWLGYGYTLIFGEWISRFLVLASILNFLLFFGKDIRYKIKTGRRHMEFQARSYSRPDEKRPFHICTVCEITDLTHPDMDFRYCMECKGSRGYCTEHIFNHPHILIEEKAQADQH